MFLFPRGVQAMVERYRMLERERRERSSAQRALLREVAAGAYGLEHFTEADVDRATQIIDRYADLRIGLADASIVGVVEWVDTRRPDPRRAALPDRDRSRRTRFGCSQVTPEW